jgi:hypothetical protein
VFGAGDFYLFLKRHHLGFFQERFATTKAQKIKI